MTEVAMRTEAGEAFRTEQGFRSWATEHHPSVKRALTEGRATLTRSPFGHQWFGPEDAEVKVSKGFLCDWPDGDDGDYSHIEFPETLRVEPYVLHLCRIEDGFGIYRRADCDS